MKALVLALLLADPATWMFRGDPAHTAASAAAPRTAPRVKWRFPTADRIVSSPVLANGTLYVGGEDGNLYAIDAASGRRRWSRPTRGPVSSTPAVVDGTVYALSYDGRLYALNTADGAPRWTFSTRGERHFEAKGLHGLQPAAQTFLDPFDCWLSSPAVVDGVVYFGSGDGHVYAVDATTGRARWSFPTGDVVHASPAVAGGVVYVGSWDGNFYAIDAASGKERWRFEGGRDEMIHNQVGFQSSATVVDGVVYVGSRDSKLYALDAATGQERWRFDNEGSWVIGSPTVAGGRLYFATSDSRRIHALDLATGKPVVSETGKAYMFSSPVVAGDVLLIAALNGTLQAREAATLKLLWEFTVERAKKNEGWLLTADGAMNMPMIFTSNWGAAPLASIHAQFGVGALFATPVVADGVVYLASTDGAVYALE